MLGWLLTGSLKINGLIIKQMEIATASVKLALQTARQLTIGLDIWTNKGFTHSDEKHCMPY